MTSLAIDSAPSRAERRHFQRVRVKVYGRYMLEDRTEHPCQVIDMSPGNALLRCERVGALGERVIAYLDHIGRIEGVITRLQSDGFAITLIASDRKRDKLAAQLTWLANKHELDLPEDSRHERITPRNPISIGGTAVEIDVRPALGTAVTLGTMRGRVVRHFEDGIAIEFAVLQREESLQAEFSQPRQE